MTLGVVDFAMDCPFHLDLLVIDWFLTARLLY